MRHLRPKPHQTRERRRGAAVVEFAVIAPLFFLLLSGIIEFGQAFRIQHSLSASARRAARAAVIEGATSTVVSEKAQDDCYQTLGIDPEHITVVVTVDGVAGSEVGDAGKGSEVSVTVSIPYAEAGVGFFTNTFVDSTLSSTCTLEHE